MSPRKHKLLIVSLGFLSSVIWGQLLWAQPQLFHEDAVTPLNRGYDALKAGDLELAQQEFEKVIKIDRYNPYALNNLAVIAEKQGKLKEAMAYLLEAETYAAEYTNKPEEICEVGGLCLAVKPTGERGGASSIAPLIHGNINLLRIKMGKTKNQP